MTSYETRSKNFETKFVFLVPHVTQRRDFNERLDLVCETSLLPFSPRQSSRAICSVFIKLHTHLNKTWAEMVKLPFERRQRVVRSFLVVQPR